MKFGYDFENENDILHVDLTPLIDVIFMLVIFFILTMSFTSPVIDLTLPNSMAATVSREKNPDIKICISKDGNFYYQKKSISLIQIKELLDKQKDSYLNIYADKEAKFQSFIEIVDIAKEKRSGKFSITTTDKADD